MIETKLIRVSLEMSALPFFIPPDYLHRRFQNNTFPHEVDCFIPQNFGGPLSIVRFSGPQSWHPFETVRLTIARNAILERIIDAADEARILNCLLARISACFNFSFDIMFPGSGLATFCQHRPEYAHEVDRICDELARFVVNSVGARYQLTLHWAEIYDRLTQEFHRLMNQCDRSLQNLKSIMEDPVLHHYAHLNSVFNDWWTDRFDEVVKLGHLLHDPDVVVPPTVRNVLSEISRQAPNDERVQIITNISGVYQTMCTLTNGNLQLADKGQVFAEFDQLSSGPDMSLLLGSFTI